MLGCSAAQGVTDRPPAEHLFASQCSWWRAESGEGFCQSAHWMKSRFECRIQMEFEGFWNMSVFRT
jgi:hypothetical protein